MGRKSKSKLSRIGARTTSDLCRKRHFHVEAVNTRRQRRRPIVHSVPDNVAAARALHPSHLACMAGPKVEVLSQGSIFPSAGQEAWPKGSRRASLRRRIRHGPGERAANTGHHRRIRGLSGGKMMRRHRRSPENDPGKYPSSGSGRLGRIPHRDQQKRGHARSRLGAKLRSEVVERFTNAEVCGDARPARTSAYRLSPFRSFGPDDAGRAAGDHDRRLRDWPGGPSRVDAIRPNWCEPSSTKKAPDPPRSDAIRNLKRRLDRDRSDARVRTDW